MIGGIFFKKFIKNLLKIIECSVQEFLILVKHKNVQKDFVLLILVKKKIHLQQDILLVFVLGNYRIKIIFYLFYYTSPNGKEILASYSGEDIYLFNVDNTKETDRPDFLKTKKKRKIEKEQNFNKSEEELGDLAYSKGLYKKSIFHFSNEIEKNNKNPKLYIKRASGKKFIK